MSATSSATSTAVDELVGRIIACLDDAVRDESFILGAHVRRLEERITELTGKAAVAVSSAAVGLMLGRHEQFAGAEVTVAPGAGDAARSIVDRQRRLVQVASTRWGGLSHGEHGQVIVADDLGGVNPGPGRAPQETATSGVMLLVDIRQLVSAAAHEQSRRRLADADAVVIYGPRDYTYAAGDFGIVACSAQTAQRLRVLRNHGRSGLGTYLHAEIGFNNRMDEVHARMLLERINADSASSTDAGEAAW